MSYHENLNLHGKIQSIDTNGEITKMLELSDSNAKRKIEKVLNEQRFKEERNRNFRTFHTITKIEPKPLLTSSVAE